MNNKNGKISLSTSAFIAVGFLIAIFVGSIILTLPISSASGQATSYIDALFTSTTSVCVTGLVVKSTYEYWSLFGKIVILILIQIGGLGVITFTTSLLLIFKRRVTLKDRIVLQDAFNLKSLSGIVNFTKHVILGTFAVEMSGAILYSFTFIPEFGFRHGAWLSIFTAISAFCNAGIDLLGPDSLAPYVSNVNVNLTTMYLIVMGGLGFIVWFDIIDNIKNYRNGNVAKGTFFRHLSLHTKIVLSTTLFLILFGAFVVFIFENNNPGTIGTLSLPDKIMASFFQSITTRTAGFLTFSQKNLQTSTVLFCLIFMFIGGSPVGTAGGVKTATFALVIISAMAAIKGEEHGMAFNRRLPTSTMRKALAVILISLVFVFTGIILLLTYTDGDLVDIMYEVVSAVATVGLTRDFTGTLNNIGKAIIIVCMYAGRIGPVTLPMIFASQTSKYGLAQYPKEDITVG